MQYMSYYRTIWLLYRDLTILHGVTAVVKRGKAEQKPLHFTDDVQLYIYIYMYTNGAF